MKKFISILFLIAPALAFSQAIVKGGGIVYTNGAPTHSININTDAEVAIDTASGFWYERSRDGLGWILAGFRVQKHAGTSPPSATPLDKQSEVLLNDADSLYRWRSGSWRHINKVLVYTAGTGISVTGTVIANTGDLSATNEGTLGVGAGGANTSLLTSNTSGATGVTFVGGGIVAMTESTSSNGGSITITATEVDGSTTNELQTYSHSGTTSYTNTLSNSGGSFTLQSGGIVGISNSSGTVTISATEVDGSVSNEGSISVGAGSSTTSLIQSNTSGSATVTLQAGTNITLSESGNTITIDAAGGGGSTDLTFSGASSPVTLNSSSGTDVTFTAGGIASFSATSGNITITATEVDGSVSNEGSLTVAAGSGMTSIINSNTSGQTGVTLTAAGILTISESGNVITLTGTEVDGSISNEGSLTVAAGTSTTSIINSNTSGQTGVTLEAGTNVTISESGNTITIAASGGGGSTDLTFSGSSSPVTLNSSTGTDVTITAGSGISLSATSGNITIAATGGGASNYQLFRDDGSDITVQPTANFVSTGDIVFTLTNDGANLETEVSADVPANAIQYAEIQTVAASRILGNPTGSTADVSEISLATGLSFVGTALTPADASATNELQTYSHSGTTSYTNTLSNSGGSFTLQASGIVTISNSSGTVTIGATEVDGSTTNEAWTIDGDDADTEVISNQTVKFQGAGITTTDYNATTDVLLITSTEVDGSTTNEAWTIDADDVDTEVVSNQTIKFQGAGIATTDYNATTDVLLITATEVDGSTTNEALTISDGTDSEALGGQTLTVSGAGIATADYVIATNTLTITATEVDGSITNEGSLTVAAGTGTTSIINSNTSGQTGVTLTAAGVLTISESGNVITLTATEVDGSATNEAWTIDGDDADTEVISNQTVKFQGAGITTTDYNATTDVLLITSTEVDGSTTNEVLTISDGTDSEALGGQTLTVSGAGIATADYVTATNTLTITATEVDGSVSNEGSLTVAAGSGTTSIINSNTSGQTGVTLTAAGILTISESGNVITLTGTEVDGSISNEGSLTVAAGTGTTSIINSNTSGQTGVTLEAGTNVTISESGNTITIAASGAGSTDLTFSGGASPYTLNSSSGTDVTFTAGSGISLSATSGNITIATTGGGGGAPTDAQYLTLAANGSLSDERVFTAGINASTTDAGAGSTLTVDVLGGSQTTSQFTADQDNFSPTNWSTRTTHYVSSDASMRAITSFEALPDGTLRRIVNTGSHHIYIPGEHPDGTASNRVITDCDIFIPPNGGVVTIYYDGNVSRWRIESSNFDAASQGVNGAYGHYYNFSVGATITGDWGTLTLVGNNDVADPTSSLLSGYSSNTTTSATGQGSWYFTDVQLNPTEYGLTHTVGSALVQITGNLSTSTQRYTAQVAFIPTPSSTTLAVNNSIGIRYSDNINSGKWEGFTRNNAGSETTVDLGVTAATNTGYVLTVCVDKANTEARFYINGGFRGRITATMPTSGTDYGFRGGIWKSVGTSLREIVTPWATFYTVKGF